MKLSIEVGCLGFEVVCIVCKCCVIVSSFLEGMSVVE